MSTLACKGLVAVHVNLNVRSGHETIISTASDNAPGKLFFAPGVMAVPDYLRGIFRPLIYLDRWDYKTYAVLTPNYLILRTQGKNTVSASKPHHLSIQSSQLPLTCCLQ